MLNQRSLNIMFLGIFIVACGATALLYFVEVIEADEVAPTITMISGILIIAMAAIRLLSTKLMSGAFGTAFWGSVLFLTGAVWLLWVRGVFTAYTFWAVLAFIVGALAVLLGVSYLWVTREEAKRPRGRPKKQSSSI